MEQSEVKQQARSFIDELLTYSYAQIFDILPTEKKLQELHEQSPNSIEVLIGLMFAAIMLGKRQEALDISDKIWTIGGELSDFFELIYTNNLLNLGEIERARIILEARLANIGDNLQNFYMVMTKYALLSGRLTLLQQISDYPNMYERESDLFDFAESHALNFSIKDYRAIIRIILDNLKDVLCAWEYNMYLHEGIELVFYTSLDIPQNEKLQEQLFEKINGYFTSMEQPPLEDLFLLLQNIKLHPAWIETKSDEA